MRRWTQEEVQFLKDNYKTMSYIDIGEHLGRKDSAIRAKCHELNLVKVEQWTQEDIEFVINNYNEMSNKDIGEHLNKTTVAVSIKAKKLGLKKSPYYCNYNYFVDIDTEEKAYWLGFIYADGYVSFNPETGSGTIGIELQVGDIEHLRKFNKSIGGNYKIVTRNRLCTINPNKPSWHDECGIRIYSKKMANDLVRWGVNERKSYNLDFLQLPEPLMRHFIRGYFDGNGSLGWRKDRNLPRCDISCNEMSFLEPLRKYLYSSLEINSTILKEDHCNRLYIYSGQQVYKLLDYLYKDSSIYLDRKFQRYQSIIQNNSQKCLAI